MYEQRALRLTINPGGDKEILVFLQPEMAGCQHVESDGLSFQPTSDSTTLKKALRDVSYLTRPYGHGQYWIQLCQLQAVTTTTTPLKIT